MRPKLPPTVQVGPMLYEVSDDQAEINRLAVAEGEPELGGHADHTAGRITVQPGHARDYEATVVLHEVLHALFFVSGLANRSKAEEDIIDTLSPLLLDVLRRNPALLAYLTETS